MHRIDDPTAVPTLPAPRVQGTPGYFTGGSPGSSGFAATVVRYEFMNALQEEISHVIETAGMALDKTDNGQLLIAMRRIFLARIVLTAPLTIFVNPVTGNDSNNGLTPTTAFLTIQAAVNAVYRNYDFNGYPCVIQLADGDYNYTLTGGVAVQFFGMPFGCGVGAFSLVGNYQNPSAVSINATNGNCIAVFNANINIKGLSLSATGNVSTVYQTQGLGLTVNGAGWCDVQYSNFATAVRARLPRRTDQSSPCKAPRTASPERRNSRCPTRPADRYGSPARRSTSPGFRRSLASCGPQRPE